MKTLTSISLWLNKIIYSNSYVKVLSISFNFLGPELKVKAEG